MIIYKALYGLRSSGARWHDRFSDCLRSEGFIPCKAEPDIWMRAMYGVYEYVAVYMDDCHGRTTNIYQYIGGETPIQPEGNLTNCIPPWM